jgi:hypothetical protein
MHATPDRQPCAAVVRVCTVKCHFTELAASVTKIHTHMAAFLLTLQGVHPMASSLHAVEH